MPDTNLSRITSRQSKITHVTAHEKRKDEVFMKVIVPFKVVPDSQDIMAQPGGALDFSKAKNTISDYDLNALEIAASLGAEAVVAITAGPASIDDSKLKKNVLARGVDELFMTADDACKDMDAHATAHVLKELVEKAGGADLIILGDGSADNYAQQVDVHLASHLGLPVVTAVSHVEVDGTTLKLERVLEDVVETVEVSLPCVISVTPDVALPRIPGMKDILAAGKKPMNVEGGAEVPAATIELVELKAPEQADRKLDVRDASEDGAIDAFVAALKASM